MEEKMDFEDLTPSQAMIRQMMGFIPARAVLAATKLGIADKIDSEGTTAGLLAERLKVDLGAMNRLLRVLDSIGVLNVDANDKISLNPLGEVICGVGGLLHIPFVAFEMLQGSIMTFNTATALSILFVAIFPTVLTVMFYNYGIEKLGPNRAGVYMYSLPVITAVLAFLFLGEVIAMFHVIGAIVIVLGIYLTVRGTPRPAPKPADVRT